VTVGPKRLELLHEVLPTATTLALLVNPTSPNLADADTKEQQAPTEREQHVTVPKHRPLPRMATEPRDDGEQREEMTPEQPRRTAMVSAPPTREVASSRTGRPLDNRVTLSPSEREIAKASGLTEVEYATQKLRLQQAKRDDPARFSER
jgi:hypothetical protein